MKNTVFGTSCICHVSAIPATFCMSDCFQPALADYPAVSFLFVYLHNKYICKYKTVKLGDQLSQNLPRWLLLIRLPLPPQTSSPWSCTCLSWRPEKPNVQSGSYLKVINSVLFENCTWWGHLELGNDGKLRFNGDLNFSIVALVCSKGLSSWKV